MASTAASIPAPSSVGAAAPQPRFHYAWVVVAAAFLVGALNATFMWAFTFVLIPIADQFGWQRGEISVTFTLQYLVFAFASIGGGWLVDKIGARLTLIAGSVLLVISLVLSSTVTELWQLYLYFGILMGVSRSAFIAPLHTVVSIWFRRRLGLAMGVVSASLGIGPFVFAPIMLAMIQAYGWQQTFFILGLACGGAMAGLSFLIRNRPADLGLLPYGEVGSLDSVKRPPVQRGVFYDGTQEQFLNHAKSTQPFYLLIGIHFLGCTSHAVLLAQLAPMILGNGAPSPLVSLTVMLTSGFSVIGYFVFSMLADKKDGRTSLAVAFTCQVAGILIMLFAQQDWQFYLFALLFGVGMGGEMVVFPIINRQYYGNAPVGTLYGIQMFGAGIGMGLGGLMGGVLFDQLGNYSLSIYLAAGAGLLGVILIGFLVHPRTGRRRGPARQTRTAPGDSIRSALTPTANGSAAAPGPVAVPATATGQPFGDWAAERAALETALAEALAGWSARAGSDGELAEVLEILAARSRDRAFRLKRSARTAGDAVNGDGPVAEWCLPADASDRVRLAAVALVLQPALTADPATSNPADLATLEQIRASVRETLELVEEQSRRRGGTIAVSGLREITGGSAIWTAGGQLGWKSLAGVQSAGGAAVLWVWQRPATRSRLSGGEARLVVPLQGGGAILSEWSAPIPVVRGQAVEIGAEMPVEVAAGDEGPLAYLVVSRTPVDPPAPVVPGEPTAGELVRAAVRNGSPVPATVGEPIEI